MTQHFDEYVKGLDQREHEFLRATPADPLLLDLRSRYRDPRTDFYMREVLRRGGIKSEPGLSVGAKWVKFILIISKQNSTRNITPTKWKEILDDLDTIRRYFGDKAIVNLIEFHVKREANAPFKKD